MLRHCDTLYSYYMDLEIIIKEYGAEYISSRTNHMTVMLSKLTDKKYRDEYRLFLAEGIKLTAEALEYADPNCIVLSRSTAENNQTANELMKRAKAKGVRIIVFADSAFEKVSTEKAPQGVISVVKYLDDIHCISGFDSWQRNKRLLMLDEIRDPGNLGTILRSAEALGRDGVILAGCADIYSSKTVRSAMGTLFRIPLYITNDGGKCVDVMKKNGRRVLASALGEYTLTLGEYDICDGDCLVIGNEGHGISVDVLEKCTACVKIPMAGNTESLNASAAAACILWEYFRRNKK